MQGMLDKIQFNHSCYDSIKNYILRAVSLPPLIHHSQTNVIIILVPTQIHSANASTRTLR